MRKTAGPPEHPVGLRNGLRDYDCSSSRRGSKWVNDSACPMPVWSATATAGMTRTISLGQVGEGDQQPINIPLVPATLALLPDRAVP